MRQAGLGRGWVLPDMLDKSEAIIIIDLLVGVVT
jgi:hypothetical protein